MENNINIIIPTRSLNELIKMVEDNDEKIELHIFENKVLFKSENIMLISSLINGTYPDTSKLIPESFETILSVNLNDYFNAIDRASLLTNESDKNTIKLESCGDFIKLSSNIPEIGNVEEKVNIIDSNVDGFKIAFSSKYMMDALKTIDDTEIVVLLNNEIKPIVIKSVKDESLIQLILPIKTY